MRHPMTHTPFADLVTELGGIIGGVPGWVVRLAGRILRERERTDHRVTTRINKARSDAFYMPTQGFWH